MSHTVYESHSVRVTRCMSHTHARTSNELNLSSLHKHTYFVVSEHIMSNIDCLTSGHCSLCVTCTVLRNIVLDTSCTLYKCVLTGRVLVDTFCTALQINVTFQYNIRPYTILRKCIHICTYM